VPLIDCRTFVAGMGLASLGARALRAQAVPNSAGTAPPRVKPPANACDCHMHLYDARYPALPGATVRPPDALVNHYQLLKQRLGTSRNVVVHPAATYGFDHRITLEGAAAFGPTARVIAVVETSVTDAELKRLDEHGVRGTRLNLHQASGTTPEMIEPLSHRVRDLGWHLQLYMPADVLVRLEPVLLRVPTPLVFDHFAAIPQPDGVTHPAYRTIRKLLDTGRAWLKLSAPYITSKTGPPYRDVTMLAKTLVKAAPERLVWASDWPHPAASERPDDALMFDLLAEWAPDEAVRRRILVQNPETLYWFQAAG
jgi:D-galactarolactone isomerase